MTKRAWDRLESRHGRILESDAGVFHDGLFYCGCSLARAWRAERDRRGEVAAAKVRQARVRYRLTPD